MSSWGLVCIALVLSVTTATARVGTALQDDVSERTRFDSIRNSNGACISNPCLNNGLCVASSEGFLCICIDGHLGVFCERRADECPMDVVRDTGCQNNALCKLDAQGMPRCHCDAGYSGDRCEFTIDYCADSPCTNAGMCAANGHGYECACPDGFSGTNCQINDMELQGCMNQCEGSEECWRSTPKEFTSEWGYGDLTCNSLDSCFQMGRRPPADNQTLLGYIDVQLRPIQVQPGDTIVFIVTEGSDISSDDFAPFYLKSGKPDAFLQCDFTGATKLSSDMVGVDQNGSRFRIETTKFLAMGTNYFATDLNMFLQCKFGLRLNVTMKEATCHDPDDPHGSAACHGRGRCATTYLSPGYQCHCCHGYSGTSCEHEDPCFVNPCVNDGRCLDEGGSGIYSCQCTSGYEGRRCEQLKNYCKGDPCQNGGMCTSLVTGYQCQCLSDYSGSHCEMDLNQCATLPCKNGATCQRKTNSFECHCAPGYQGSVCEIDNDECASNPCQNGACLDGVNSYRCHCNSGFTGMQCELRLNLCESNPCVNGQCIHSGTDFECSCGMAFVGRLCEIKLDLCSLEEFCVAQHAMACVDQGTNVSCACHHGYEGSNCAVDTDDCAPAQCPVATSYCVDRVGGYECVCTGGYTGEQCNVPPNVPEETLPTRKDTLHIATATSPSPVVDSRTFHNLEMGFSSSNCYTLQQQSSIFRIQLAISSCASFACQCRYDAEDVLLDFTSVGCYGTGKGKFNAKVALPANLDLKQLRCYLHSCLDSAIATGLGEGMLQTDTTQKNAACDIVASTGHEATRVEEEEELGIGIIIAIIACSVVMAMVTVGVMIFFWKRRATTRVATKHERSVPVPSNGRMVAFGGEFYKSPFKRPCRTTKVKKLPQHIAQEKKVMSPQANVKRLGAETR